MTSAFRCVRILYRWNFLARDFDRKQWSVNLYDNFLPWKNYQTFFRIVNFLILFRCEVVCTQKKSKQKRTFLYKNHLRITIKGYKQQVSLCKLKRNKSFSLQLLFLPSFCGTKTVDNENLLPSRTRTKLNLVRFLLIFRVIVCNKLVVG